MTVFIYSVFDVRARYYRRNLHSRVCGIFSPLTASKFKTAPKKLYRFQVKNTRAFFLNTRATKSINKYSDDEIFEFSKWSSARAVYVFTRKFILTHEHLEALVEQVTSTYYRHTTYWKLLAFKKKTKNRVTFCDFRRVESVMNFHAQIGSNVLDVYIPAGDFRY